MAKQTFVIIFPNMKLLIILYFIKLIARLNVFKHKNDWSKKKATIFRSEKVEIISTFQRNRHFRKVSKLLRMSKSQKKKKQKKTKTKKNKNKKRCRRDIPLTFRLV